jgi:CRISPR-associated protein Csd1
MIIEALNAYYERLAADPKSDVAAAGFSRQKISFCVVLNDDGSLHEFKNLVNVDGGKKSTPSLTVLGNSKPSGQGINPCFLWDNAAYMLGYKADDPKPERTREAFDAFRARHLAAESEINDSAFSAVCRFLEAWNPDQAAGNPTLAELGTGFGVFRMRAGKQYLHEGKAVTKWWLSHLDAQEDVVNAVVGQCSVTGEIATLARLHEPKIKGVWGAQSSGASLVSFNCDAFESYGKTQGINAPLNEKSAAQYCKALNQLLEDPLRRFQIGDASTVFWTEVPSEAEGLLSFVFEPTRAAEDDNRKLSVEKILAQISRGSYPQELGPSETPFYILGLSPNAARISVRFWLQSSLGEFVEQLRLHFTDLALVHAPHEPDHPAMWLLLRETVRDSKDLPPLLAGSTMRSILTGAPYPAMLVSAILRRIQADREVRYMRAAMLKACLNRNSRAGIQTLAQEIEMALNPDRPETAYQLGRFFAELEKSQEDALPGINATIKDRFFGAASATPGSVFPRLIRLNQHHLGKLEKGNRAYRERRIRDIAARIENFSPHLNLRDQGLFAIGYYHQRQDIFTKKADVANEQE